MKKKVRIEKAPKKKVRIEGLPEAQNSINPNLIGNDQEVSKMQSPQYSYPPWSIAPTLGNIENPINDSFYKTKPKIQKPKSSFRFTGVNLMPISGNPYLQKGMNYLSQAINKIPGTIEYSRTGKISDENIAPFYNYSSYSPYIGEPEIDYKEVEPYYTKKGKLKYREEGGYSLPIAQTSIDPNSIVSTPEYMDMQKSSLQQMEPIRTTNISQPLNTQLSAPNKLQETNLAGQRGLKKYMRDLAKGAPAYDASLAAINFGKGALDIVGSNLENKEAQRREAEMFTQSVFSDALNVTPYETQGYGFTGRNALAADGMQIRDIGGMGEPNVEVEGREHIKLPNGFSQEIQGKSHAQGGIPLNLPQGTQIFSEKLKDPETKKSYADMAKKFETKKYIDLLNSKTADPIQKTTAEMMIQQNNAKLEQLFALQEQNKLAGAHGPEVQEKAMMEKEQSMMAHGGYHLPKYQIAGKTKDESTGYWDRVMSMQTERDPRAQIALEKAIPFYGQEAEGVGDYISNLFTIPQKELNHLLTGYYESPAQTVQRYDPTFTGFKKGLTSIATDPMIYPELPYALGKGVVKGAVKGVTEAVPVIAGAATAAYQKAAPYAIKAGKLATEFAKKYLGKISPEVLYNITSRITQAGLHLNESATPEDVAKVINPSKKQAAVNKKVANTGNLPQPAPSDSIGNFQGIKIINPSEDFEFGGHLPVYQNAGQTKSKKIVAYEPNQSGTKIRPVYEDGTKGQPVSLNPRQAAAELLRQIRQASPQRQMPASQKPVPAQQPARVVAQQAAPQPARQIANAPNSPIQQAVQQIVAQQQSQPADFSGWKGQIFKTNEGIFTPTNVNLNVDPLGNWRQFAERYAPFDERITKAQTPQAIAALQENIYDDYLDTEHGRKALNDMWLEHGVTNKLEEKYADIAKKIKNKENLTIDDLNRLRENYIDTFAGKRLPEYLQPKIYTPNIKGPTSQAPEEKETTDVKKETIKETKYLRPEIGVDMALGIPLPQVYGRDPLNYYKIQPNFIDPRYLDIQPQLNEIARGQRAIQSNIGSRGSADIANLLQAQANAASAQQQAFGQKYNYDRAQDAAAQQFNAQAKQAADQYNQASWFQQLEDAIRRREGAIDTQQRTDAQAAIENDRRMKAFYGNKGLIEDTYYPYRGMTGEQMLTQFGTPLLAQYGKKEESKPKKKKSSNLPRRDGGKIKIKPKINSNFIK